MLLEGGTEAHIFGFSYLMAVKTNGFTEGLPEELIKQLLALALKWGDVIDMKKLKVIQLTDAMTNKVFRISWPSRAENVVRTVLVRIYGESANVLFSRDDEIRNAESISMHEFGPRLHMQFPGGRIEEFIHARGLSASDLRDPETSALIAAKLREFHNLDMPGSKNVVLWERLRNWFSKARSMSTPELAKEFGLDTIEEEIRILESELSQGNQDIGFCHNDLHCCNMMIDNETRTLTIIDYECAGYNPVAYDLGNHFCEMTANYHSDTPHVFDYGIYPDFEERQRFVWVYLSSTGHQPSNAEVMKLVSDAEKYTLANHLLMGIWGIISKNVNNNDFDYIDYARQRFEQYWLNKPLLLGTTTAVPVDTVNGNGNSTT